jgi:thioredoxin 1
MAADNVQTLTDGNFEETVTASGTPVLVDFWAEWCAPCRRLEPTIDALATELNGKLVIGKLNIDENPIVTSRFAVRSIPTLLLFKGGKVVESIVGLAEKPHLKGIIERHL